MGVRSIDIHTQITSLYVGFRLKYSGIKNTLLPIFSSAQFLRHILCAHSLLSKLTTNKETSTHFANVGHDVSRSYP